MWTLVSVLTFAVGMSGPGIRNPEVTIHTFPAAYQCEQTGIMLLNNFKETLGYKNNYKIKGKIECKYIPPRLGAPSPERDYIVIFEDNIE